MIRARIKLACFASVITDRNRGQLYQGTAIRFELADNNKQPAPADALILVIIIRLSLSRGRTSRIEKA